MGKPFVVWLLAILLISIAAFPEATEAQKQRVQLSPDTARFRISAEEMETGSPFVDKAFERRLDYLFENAIPDRFETNPKNLHFIVLGKTNSEKWNAALRADSRWGVLDSFNRAAIHNASNEQKNDLLERFLEIQRAMSVKSWMVKQGYAEPARIQTGIYGAVDEAESGTVSKTVDIVVIRRNSTSASNLLADLPAFEDLQDRQEDQDSAIRENRDEINKNRDAVNENRSDIESLEREVDQLDLLLGALGSRNDLGNLVGGHVGLRLNNVRLFHHVDASASYMTEPTTSGSIKLPQVGMTDMRSHAFRVDLAFFPVRYAGLVAGVQRTEEVFLDVGQNGSSKKAGLAGLRLELPIGWFSISAEGLWAPGVYSRFDQPEDETSMNKFQVGLRITTAL